MNRRLLEIGREVALELATIDGVVAIVQGGSAATGHADEHSDLDLDVYSRGEIAIQQRRQIVSRRGRVEGAIMGHRWYEGGDLWIEAASGTVIDVLYRRVDDIETKLKRVLVDHKPSLGYTTALLYNVQTAVIHHDAAGWFAALRSWSRQPYPEALAQAIIDYNLPLLRGMPFAFRELLQTAQARGDSFAALDNIDRFWASYLDVLFALNRVAHPGEKRLLDIALQLEQVPASLQRDFTTLVENQLSPRALEAMDSMVNELEELLARRQA